MFGDYSENMELVTLLLKRSKLLRNKQREWVYYLVDQDY